MLAGMSGPTVDFWQSHFDAGRTPRDRGEASPKLAPARSQRAVASRRLVYFAGYEL
jgi:hypothetical protein